MMVGEVCPTCPEGFEPPEPPQRARIAVFFDGTLNNRGNSVSTRNDPETSFANAPSNISKGEASTGRYPGVDNAGQKYYIEGIGTTTDDDDSFFGYALGTGGTGVLAKVGTGYGRLLADVMALDRSRPIEYVHIDTFGFSRGAAAARAFVYLCLRHPQFNVKKKLTDAGFDVGEVRVKFVGLYDTVSSYGANHNDDTRQLELDSVRYADYTFQLAAGEEHRKNFSLTDIQSARSGKQIFLPGVHSDIGGGYVPNGRESDIQVIDLDWRGIFLRSTDLATLERERQWLIDRGWYTDAELSQPNMSWEILANRSGIKNTYSNLPLNMMADEARPRGVPFLPTIAGRHPIPTEQVVQNLRRMINASVFNGNVRKDGSWKTYWLRMINDNLNEVRHDFLHTSGVYGGIGGPHQPRFSSHPSDGGVRIRVVHRG